MNDPFDNIKPAFYWTLAAAVGFILWNATLTQWAADLQKRVETLEKRVELQEAKPDVVLKLEPLQIAKESK